MAWHVCALVRAAGVSVVSDSVSDSASFADGTPTPVRLAKCEVDDEKRPAGDAGAVVTPRKLKKRSSQAAQVRAAAER